MFENTLEFNFVLLFVVFIVLLIALKALNSSGLFLKESEKELGWWIELYTAQPNCKYYFGPFSSTAEAENSKIGYVQDLETEGATGITVKVKWCKPRQLTSPEF